VVSCDVTFIPFLSSISFITFISGFFPFGCRRTRVLNTARGTFRGGKLGPGDCYRRTSSRTRALLNDAKDFFIGRRGLVGLRLLTTASSGPRHIEFQNKKNKN
jgi:hypothetical protein